MAIPFESDVDLKGPATLVNQALLRFGEATANGSNWVAFRAPASIASDVTWTLPAADGTDGQFLKTNGTGTLSWAAGGGSATPAGTAGEIQIHDGEDPAGLGAVTGFKWDDEAEALDVPGDIILDDGVAEFVTTLQMVTPTTNRTISFPNATGTVGLIAGSSGQLAYNNAGAYAGVSDGTVIASGPRFTLGFGYGTGAGGTVTQATSKATGVTLDELCGTITLNSAALAANTTVTFVLTNSTIAATDMIVLNHSSVGTFGGYTLNGRAAAGSASIDVRNVTSGSLSEAIVLRFAVIKAVTT